MISDDAAECSAICELEPRGAPRSGWRYRTVEAGEASRAKRSTASKENIGGETGEASLRLLPFTPLVWLFVSVSKCKECCFLE